MIKNNYFKYVITLAIICFVAPAILSVVHNIRPGIEAEKSLREVLPAAQSFEAVKKGSDILYYKALGKNKSVLGYAFKAVKKGYSSDIVTMVGMDKNGVITRIKILSQNETPGMGSRVSVESWFQEQFTNKKTDELDSAVRVITGATITSHAVIESIKIKAKEVLKDVLQCG